ncbi:helix-turn-helix domain-containing protein [Streptomyces hygroscopicus]|uniref:helix-turn-helix domain-containing protein n=1 Tax=Streptomyces hygroscopicus TaxID=1912 RepID=UPI00379CAA54
MDLRFRMHDPETVRKLMRHTGDGSRTTVRDLARCAGVHPSLISELLRGEQQTASSDVAAAIARRIGTDLLVLWAPCERTASAAQQTPEAKSA